MPHPDNTSLTPVREARLLPLLIVSLLLGIGLVPLYNYDYFAVKAKQYSVFIGGAHQ
jgi:hypothetical protein